MVMIAAPWFCYGRSPLRSIGEIQAECEHLILGLANCLYAAAVDGCSVLARLSSGGMGSPQEHYYAFVVLQAYDVDTDHPLASPYQCLGSSMQVIAGYLIVSIASLQLLQVRKLRCFQHTVYSLNP